MPSCLQNGLFEKRVKLCFSTKEARIEEHQKPHSPVVKYFTRQTSVC